MINKKQLLKTFLDLVKIDSPSGNEKKVATFIISYLKKLKIKASRDKYGNVTVFIPAPKISKGKKMEPLMLAAHMDTVQPGVGIKPVVKNDTIKSKSDTILGADNKVAIAVILEVVKYYSKKKNMCHRPLELVFTREEEIGCIGAQKLDYRKIKSKECLVMDSCRPLGNITIAAPFIYVIDIEVKGRASHAGSFPEKGVNAIHIASKAIADLKIGRINKTTTCNIGLIEGGEAMNSVPERVLLRGDARSLKLENAQKQVDIINKSFKKYVRLAKGKLKFKTKLACSGFDYKRSDPMIKKIVSLNKQLRFKTNYEKSGGATDANIFAGHGIKAIDISYGGKHPHSTKETIKISELSKLSEFLVEFIYKQ
jgi:tripeptide aminopeptidase